MKVLLLLALIGSSLAFTPGREYKYRYEGRLGLGMPEIRNKFSGVGIKAVVTFQFQSDDETFIKLSEVQFGEYVGDAGVRVTNPLPIQFSPLRGDAKALEEPFQVFFKKDNNQVMVVPQSDPEWIVNLRKSVAQLFLIEPIRGNFGFSEMLSKEGFSMEAFSVTEPTLFGFCSADYAVRPFETASVPVGDDQDAAFVLTRTVNFDRCQEQVRIQQTSVANIDDITKNLFGSVASRSSVMTVKFVGKAGDFKVQEGSVHGYFSVNPFGVPTDKLMSLTNQTFFLESESEIRNKFVVPAPTRFVNTFFMEVASPFAPPQNPPTFVNYYNKKDASYTPFTMYNSITGIPFSPSYIKKFQSTLDRLIAEASTLMFSVGDVPKGKISPVNTNEARITSLLSTATEVVFGIDVRGLEQLFEKYFNDKTEVGQMKMRLFIDVCASSGMNAPVKFLVNQMQKQKISPERITSIFVTFANNFIATPVLPEILRYVKTLDFEKHPFMTTNVYINFASILRKVCITKETVPFQVFGREECNPRIITEDFIPFLKQKFFDSRKSYERCVIIQSFSNLATIEALNFVGTILEGDYDLRVKEIAIYSLNYLNGFKTLKKDDVFNALMPFVHDTTEDPLLRQAALSVLLSWRPSPSWWYRLAASTWNEPSESVGSFIYSLIKNNYYNTDSTFSQENRIAQFILPLTKRFPSTGSFTYLYNRRNQNDYTEAYYNFAVLKDDTSAYPRSLFDMFIANYGGVTVPFMQTSFSTSIINNSPATIVEEISKMIPNEMHKLFKTSTNTKAAEIFEEIKKQLTSTMTTTDNARRESNLWFRVFPNFEFLAPFNSKTMELPFNTNTFDFLRSLADGKNLYLSKYFNPAPIKFFIPTELGIPFFAQVSTPTVYAGEGSMKLDFSMASFNIDANTNFKFATKYITDFQAVLPWNEKIISSGVETMKSVNLPSRIRFSFKYQDFFVNASLSIVPSYDKEFAGFYSHNIPYVTRRSMYPGQLPADYENFEILTVKETDRGIHKYRFVFDKQYTGIDGAIDFEGDIPYPFTYGNFYDNINKPYEFISKFVSPSTKLYAAAVSFNFGTSETKAIFPSVAFTLPTFLLSKNVANENENQAFIARFVTTGTNNRFFESNYQSKVLSRDANVKRSEILYRSASEFPNAKPQVFCVTMETRRPFYYDFSTLLNQLHSRNMDYSFSGKIRGGGSCNDAQFATIKGAFKVSKDAKIDLENEITKELNINKQSKIDSEEEFIYDQVSFLVDYKEPLPSFFTNLTYNTYDVIRGSQFPYTYHNYYNVKNPKGRITVEGERYVDGRWNVRTVLPTENVQMDSFKFPFLYTFQRFFY